MSTVSLRERENIVQEHALASERRARIQLSKYGSALAYHWEFVVVRSAPRVTAIFSSLIHKLTSLYYLIGAR